MAIKIMVHRSSNVFHRAMTTFCIFAIYEILNDEYRKCVGAHVFNFFKIRHLFHSFLAVNAIVICRVRLRGAACLWPPLPLAHMTESVATDTFFNLFKLKVAAAEVIHTTPTSYKVAAAEIIHNVFFYRHDLKNKVAAANRVLFFSASPLENKVAAFRILNI